MRFPRDYLLCQAMTHIKASKEVKLAYSGWHNRYVFAEKQKATIDVLDSPEDDERSSSVLRLSIYLWRPLTDIRTELGKIISADAKRRADLGLPYCDGREEIKKYPNYLRVYDEASKGRRYRDFAKNVYPDLPMRKAINRAKQSYGRAKELVFGDRMPCRGCLQKRDGCSEGCSRLDAFLGSVTAGRRERFLSPVDRARFLGEGGREK